jgi:hypothetical protein
MNERDEYLAADVVQRATASFLTSLQDAMLLTTAFHQQVKDRHDVVLNHRPDYTAWRNKGEAKNEHEG